MAIIVGSLPAFTNFLRKYVAESSVYKFLQSTLFSYGLNSKGDSQHEAGIETFGGSGKQRKKLSYYELSDQTIAKSHITVPGETEMAADNWDQDRIVRTIELVQQEHETGLVDRLA